MTEIETRTLTTCNGKIDPANGLCDKCYQPAQTTSSFCGQLILQTPEQQAPDLDNKLWNIIQNLPKYSSDPEDYIKPSRDLIRATIYFLETEKDKLKSELSELTHLKELSDDAYVTLQKENDQLKKDKFFLRTERDTVNLENKGLRELSKAQDEYIEFLAEKHSDAAPFLHVHNWHHSKEDIDKGIVFREKIELYKESIKEKE